MSPGNPPYSDRARAFIFFLRFLTLQSYAFTIGFLGTINPIGITNFARLNLLFGSSFTGYLIPYQKTKNFKFVKKSLQVHAISISFFTILSLIIFFTFGKEYVVKRFCLEGLEIYNFLTILISIILLGPFVRLSMASIEGQGDIDLQRTVFIVAEALSALTLAFMVMRGYEEALSLFYSGLTRVISLLLFTPKKRVISILKESFSAEGIRDLEEFLGYLRRGVHRGMLFTTKIVLGSLLVSSFFEEPSEKILAGYLFYLIEGLTGVMEAEIFFSLPLLLRTKNYRERKKEVQAAFYRGYSPYKNPTILLEITLIFFYSYNKFSMERINIFIFCYTFYPLAVYMIFCTTLMVSFPVKSERKNTIIILSGLGTIYLVFETLKFIISYMDFSPIGPIPLLCVKAGVLIVLMLTLHLRVEAGVKEEEIEDPPISRYLLGLIFEHSSEKKEGG